MLGLGSNISKTGKLGVHDLGIVTSDLVLKHNYDLSSVQPLSTGAADINADAAANEYINVGAIPITTNDVTISAWVYVATFVDEAGILSNRITSGSKQGIELRCDSDGFEMIIDEAASGSTASASTAKNTNQWYHVCGVWDRDGSQYMYVDGVLESSSSIVNRDESLTHAQAVSIGKNHGGTDFRGYICNVGYWNRVLTQAEIKSIMNKNYAGLTSSEKEDLVSWWNLDEETATDGTAGTGGIKDYHSTNHGTLS